MISFTKKERLLKKSDFERVKKKGGRVTTSHFVLSFIGSAYARLGLIVTSQVGKAHERNRIKRVIREFFRTNKELFGNRDHVFIARSGAANLENFQIRSELVRLMEKYREKNVFNTN